MVLDLNVQTCPIICASELSISEVGWKVKRWFEENDVENACIGDVSAPLSLSTSKEVCDNSIGLLFVAILGRQCTRIQDTAHPTVHGGQFGRFRCVNLFVKRHLTFQFTKMEQVLSGEHV